MPMPGSAAAQNGLGPADGMGAGHPGARGGAGHLLGGRMHGAPPGYGAMGGSQSQSHGMGAGVFTVPGVPGVSGVPGYAHQPPGMPPGMYPHAYPHAGMPPGLPPGAAAGSWKITGEPDACKWLCRVPSEHYDFRHEYHDRRSQSRRPRMV